MPHIDTIRRALWLLGATVFLAACCLSQPATGWNANSRLALVYAVVDHGQLSIDEYQDTQPMKTGDKAEYGGHFYSDKVIGVSAIAIPVYAVVTAVSHAIGVHPSFQFVQYLLTRLAVAIPAALAAMMMANLLIRLGAVPRLAFLVTSGVFFGSMLFGYSTVFYPYLPGIACCLGALILVLPPTKTLTMRRAAAAGGLLGGALVFDLTFVIVVAVIGVFVLAAMRGLPRAAVVRCTGAAVAAAAVPLGVFAVYSTVIFGSPTIPYRYESSDFFREGMSAGVMGVTSPKLSAMWFLSFDSYRGILFWSPWLVMAIVGACWLIARDRSARPIAIASLVTFAGYFLFNAGYYEWWGGAAMGPRLMLPMFAVVPLALVAACRTDAPRVLRVGTAITLAVSVGLCLPVSMVDPQTHQGNLTSTLLQARFGDALHVGQLEALRDFYLLRWINIKPVWLVPIILSFCLCLLVIGCGTALSYRAASRLVQAPVDHAPVVQEPE